MLILFRWRWLIFSHSSFENSSAASTDDIRAWLIKSAGPRHSGCVCYECREVIWAHVCGEFACLFPWVLFFYIFFFISPAFTSFSYFNQVDRQTRGACVNTVRTGFWFSSRLKDIRLTSLWGFLFLFGKLILTWKAPGEATNFGVFFVSHPCIQITLTLSSHFCRGVVVFFFVWLNSKEK